MMSEKLPEEMTDREVEELLGRISEGAFEHQTASDFFDTLWALEEEEVEEVIHLTGLTDGRSVQFQPVEGVDVRGNQIHVGGKKLIVTLQPVSEAVHG